VGRVPVFYDDRFVIYIFLVPLYFPHHMALRGKITQEYISTQKGKAVTEANNIVGGWIVAAAIDSAGTQPNG
jgi:hypothetical protein